RSQLDAERALTPVLFAEKGRYCVHYGAKVNSPAATPGVGHWFIEEMVHGVPGTGPVTHIETHHQYVIKFNDAGQPEQMRISDIEVFSKLAYHYVSTVLEVYPFDRDRAEVILDGIDVPDNITALLPPEHHIYGDQSNYRLVA